MLRWISLKAAASRFVIHGLARVLKFGKRHLEGQSLFRAICEANELETPVRIALQCGEGRFLNGQLKHHRAGVIGYPAHHIQSPRSASYYKLRFRIKERSRFRRRTLIELVQSFDEGRRIRQVRCRVVNNSVHAKPWFIFSSPPFSCSELANRKMGERKMSFTSTAFR